MEQRICEPWAAHLTIDRYYPVYPLKAEVGWQSKGASGK